MGAEESHIDAHHVPGFNPAIETTKRHKTTTQNKKHISGTDEPTDAFFKYADVKEHIRPIYEDDTPEKKEELDEGVSGYIDLTKLLDDLGGKKKEESGSEGDLMDLPEYEDDDEEDSDEDDNDEDRGIYHHEVKHQEEEIADLFSSTAHPISIQGVNCVGEILKCQDMSPWKHQFPISRYQWYIATEIGNQVSFHEVPDANNIKFEVPSEAIGYYIQVVGIRRVEDQIRDTYGEEVEGGVYDPHVAKAKHTAVGIERKFIDVSSSAVIGPVLISDTLSFMLIQALNDGEFRAAVKLRDEIVEEENEYVKGERALKVPATLTVTKSTIQFSYHVTDKHRRDFETSSLFSFEWLSKLFGKGEQDEETLKAKARKLKGDVVASMKLKVVSFRPSKSKKSIILACEPRKKGFSHTKIRQDLIRFDVDPQIGRFELLCILLGFQAVGKFKLDDPNFWTQVYEQGDVDQAKELVQKYLEELSMSVESVPAYEEMPLSPWEY